MSASEHLSPAQFSSGHPQRMPLADILGLKSVQDPGTVRDWIDDKRSESMADQDLAPYRENWGSLRHKPIKVLDGQLADGHHRAMVAEEEGEKDMPVEHIGHPLH